VALWRCARNYKTLIPSCSPWLSSGFRCAYHKTGIIHHGKLYVFPSFLCFTSSSGLTTVRVMPAFLHTSLLLCV